jgi:murein DD-endopeptidase MepM/ murein hydrolase activator NlpD
MRKTVESRAFAFAGRLAAAGLMAALLTGCSSDATRLSDPFANPFGGSSRFSGESDTKTGALAAPVAPVATAPLPGSPQAYNVPPNAARPTRVASAAAPRPAQGSLAGWSAKGGTAVVVAQGETLDGLSRRYGVPGEAILAANSLAGPAQIHPGSQVVIPVYNAQAVAAKPTATTSKVALNDRPKTTAKPTVMAQASTKPLSATPAKDQAAAKPSETVKLAKVAKVETKKEDLDPTPTASLPPAQPAAATAVDDKGGNPEFRWPVHGRVIQGFKTGSNDGINIAVPEGTSVKAAENGTVIYASDLKGYGNLVLIRHPNGFTSAYANNGEISVKRGEQVKRGQAIAKSGQSGNVSSPQLHFELRKGSTPVDPSTYLAGL